MPTTWLLSATTHTNQVGLCVQESHFIFPYCYYTRGLSAFGHIVFTCTILGEFPIFLFKVGNLPSPHHCFVLSPFLPLLSWAPKQQPEVLSQ